jgi:hypothetical protein
VSDSPLEEMEAHESAEKAAEAVESKDKFLSQVTLTIAVLAVAAAICASLETTEGDETIVDKNEAVLNQNLASDQWNFFQAKSMKKNLYTLAADQGGPKAAAYAKTATQNAAEQLIIQKKAKAFEETRKQWGEKAEVHEHRHHRLTIASTLVHMAIAIATLAIILHRRWPWITAIGLSLAGVVIAAWAYL